MNSGFNEFIKQVPPELIIMVCGSGILFVIFLTYIVNKRLRRTRTAALIDDDDDPEEEPDDDPEMELDDDVGDLPDLDMLASPAPPPPDPAPLPRSDETFSLKLSDEEVVEVAPVLTVLRDVGDGGLIIQIGDQIYRNPPALADAEFMRRLQTTLRDLGGLTQKAEPKVEPVQPPVVEPKDDLPPLPAADAVPGDLPKFMLPDSPKKPRLGQRPSAEPIPEINIAGSIEAFLQHKLTQSPEYSDRSIHVRPALHGAIKIEVDGVFYDSVGEVEDESVRRYLAATIEEWQTRQKEQ